MLHLRKETPALVAGEYLPLHEDAAGYLAFLRRSRAVDQVCLVVLNFSDQAHTLRFDLKAEAVRLRFSSRVRDGDSDDLSQLSIAPFEIYIGELIPDR
jgi:alpha-glucosidase